MLIKVFNWFAANLPILVMCRLKLSLSSIWTPNNFTEGEASMTLSPILKISFVWFRLREKIGYKSIFLRFCKSTTERFSGGFASPLVSTRAQSWTGHCVTLPPNPQKSLINLQHVRGPLAVNFFHESFFKR